MKKQFPTAKQRITNYLKSKSVSIKQQTGVSIGVQNVALTEYLEINYSEWDELSIDKKVLMKDFINYLKIR